MDSFLKSDRGSRLVMFLFNLFRSDLQFFCFRLRRLEGMGYCHAAKALVVSPRRTAGGKSNNRFCFQ